MRWNTAPWLAASAMLAVPMAAQTPAGGKWIHFTSEDKFTGEKSDVFQIAANEAIEGGGLSGVPVFAILCKNGRWLNSSLAVPVILSGGPVDDEHRQVVMRSDGGKARYHFWIIAPDRKSMFPDKGATKDLLNGSDVRIQFPDFEYHEEVALFSPAGIDRQQLNRACGEKTFR